MKAAALAVTFVLFGAAFAADGERLVYETDSLYHHIIVSENADVRILRFHRGPARDALGSDFAQSVISLADPYSLHMRYSRHTVVGAALVDQPRRALFVGLGAGTLPKYFARAFPDCQVDCAELDARVVDVAKRYFFLGDLPNLNISVMDGRKFVRKTDAKYDLVFLDAYRDNMIPFHLMTKEFLEEVKARLNPGAVVVSNIAIQTDAQLYPWVLRTYQEAFGTLFEANVPGTINRVLIGKAEKSSATVETLVSKSKELSARLTLGFDLVACAAVFTDSSSRQQTKNVLTDDYAPVNLMRIRKADEKDWEY
jgi:spermidine synthase